MRDSLLIKMLEDRYVVLPKSRIRRLGVQHVEAPPSEDVFGFQDFGDYIKRRLARELAQHVAGALQVTKDDDQHIYTMVVDILLPEAVEPEEKEL